MDHYDPGDRASPYDPARWRPYAIPIDVPEGQVIADDCLRAALGAYRMGDTTAAKGTFEWIRVIDGGVPAYLNLATGSPGFLSGAPVYFDVVSSALHRNVSHCLGRHEAARIDTQFLAGSQAANGGGYWGRPQDGQPLTGEQAPIIGFWATADLATSV